MWYVTPQHGALTVRRCVTWPVPLSYLCLLLGLFAPSMLTSLLHGRNTICVESAGTQADCAHHNPLKCPCLLIFPDTNSKDVLSALTLIVPGLCFLLHMCCLQVLCL